jgi:hypothetical protein
MAQREAALSKVNCKVEESDGNGGQDEPDEGAVDRVVSECGLPNWKAAGL